MCRDVILLLKGISWPPLAVSGTARSYQTKQAVVRQQYASFSITAFEINIGYVEKYINMFDGIRNKLHYTRKILHNN